MFKKMFSDFFLSERMQNVNVWTISLMMFFVYRLKRFPMGTIQSSLLYSYVKNN